MIGICFNNCNLEVVPYSIPLWQTSFKYVVKFIPRKFSYLSNVEWLLEKISLVN